MLNHDVIEKGNAWTNEFLISEDLSVFERLEFSVRKPWEVKAYFKDYPNAASLAARTGGKSRVFTYTRLMLDSLKASVLKDLDVEDKLHSVVSLLNSQLSDSHLHFLPEDFAQIHIDDAGYFIKLVDDHPLWYGTLRYRPQAG